MYRLCRLMLILLLMHTALIITAHLLTRNERPAFLDLFTNPDGTPCERPCLFGVRPGKMSIEEAARVIQKHWLISDLRIIPTENYEFPLIADAKGTYSGKRFRIWLVPGPGDQVPIMATGIELGVMEYDQDIFSDFKVPITSSGTFMTVFGSPDGWDLDTNFNNSHRYYFLLQGMWVNIGNLAAAQSFYQPQTLLRPEPNDVVLSFSIREPFPADNRFRGIRWCGFTLRPCDPVN